MEYVYIYVLRLLLLKFFGIKPKIYENLLCVNYGENCLVLKFLRKNFPFFGLQL